MAANKIPGSMLQSIASRQPRPHLNRRHVAFELPASHRGRRKTKPCSDDTGDSDNDSKFGRYYDSPPFELSASECYTPSTEHSILVDAAFRYPASIPADLRGARFTIEAGAGMQHLVRRYHSRLTRKTPRNGDWVDIAGRKGALIYKKTAEDGELDLRKVRSTHPALAHASEVRLERIPGTELWTWVVVEPVGLPLYTHAGGHPVHIWPNAVNNGTTRYLNPWKEQCLNPRRFLLPLELDTVRSCFPVQVMGIRIFLSGCVVALFNDYENMVKGYKRGCPSRIANFDVKYARRLGVLDSPTQTPAWLATMLPWTLRASESEVTKPSAELEASAVTAAMEGQVVYHVFKGEVKHSIVEGVEYVRDMNTCPTDRLTDLEAHHHDAQ